MGGERLFHGWPLADEALLLDQCEACDNTDDESPHCEGCGCCQECCNCTETDCDCDACKERRLPVDE